MKYRLLLVLVASLAACSGSDVQRPAQVWQGIRIALETRPVKVSQGMNEFLVIVTEGRARVVSDLIVTLHIKGQTSRWRQAIQDGHSGVYRKALRVDAPDNELQIKIQRDDKQVVLIFPLAWDPQQTNQ